MSASTAARRPSSSTNSSCTFSETMVSRAFRFTMAPPRSVTIQTPSERKCHAKRRSDINRSAMLFRHFRTRRANDKDVVRSFGGESGGRYWVRTSDLFGVNEARYHCANRPGASRGAVTVAQPGPLNHIGEPHRTRVDIGYGAAPGRG